MATVGKKIDIKCLARAQLLLVLYYSETRKHLGKGQRPCAVSGLPQVTLLSAEPGSVGTSLASASFSSQDSCIPCTLGQQRSWCQTRGLGCCARGRGAASVSELQFPCIAWSSSHSPGRPRNLSLQAPVSHWCSYSWAIFLLKYTKAHLKKKKLILLKK